MPICRVRRTVLFVFIYEEAPEFHIRAKFQRNTDIGKSGGTDTNLKLRVDTCLQSETTHNIELECESFVNQIHGVAACVFVEGSKLEVEFVTLTDFVLHIGADCKAQVCTYNKVNVDTHGYTVDADFR